MWECDFGARTEPAGHRWLALGFEQFKKSRKINDLIISLNKKQKKPLHVQDTFMDVAVVGHVRPHMSAIINIYILNRFY